MPTYLDWVALHSSTLDRYIRGEQEVAAGMVYEAYVKAVEQLGVLDFNTASEAEREAVLAMILTTLSADILDTWGVMQERLSRLAYWDQDLRSAAMLPGLERNSPPLDLVLAIVASQVIQGMASGRWWSRQAQAAADIFGQRVRMATSSRAAIAGIMGNPSNARSVYRTTLGEPFRRAELVGGVLAVTERNVRTLVQMVAMKTIADMNRSMMVANRGVFSAVQQVSVLDDRTTEVCTTYDMKRFSLPDFKPLGHSLEFGGGVPRHWNCRSTEIPVAESSNYFSVAEPTWSYYQWVAEQPGSVQRQIMGVKQYNAYKSGSVSLKNAVSAAPSGVISYLALDDSAITNIG